MKKYFVEFNEQEYLEAVEGLRRTRARPQGDQGMNRRMFFGAAASALVAPVAPRRIYSFLWDNPLVVVPRPGEVAEFMDQCHDHEHWVRLVASGLQVELKILDARLNARTRR